MNKIDWYYVYSQRYYPFNFYLQENIPDVFKVNGIFIDQSVFDENLYKHKGEHFFSRITIKIEVILKILQEKIANHDARPFFFTDCDILVRPSAATDLLSYTAQKDIDILFQREYKETNNLTVNPGVSLIWPNERTQTFFNRVLEDIKQNKNMEMASINTQLPSSPLRWNFFDIVHVCSSITASLNNYFRFSVYHILSDGSSREIDIGNKMFEALNNGQSMDKYVNMTMKKYGRVFM